VSGIVSNSELAGVARTAAGRSVAGRFFALLCEGRTATFWTATAGGVLLWLAFPPAGLWPLAFAAPAFWLRLVRRATLAGRAPYRQLYLAGLVHWLLLIQWMRLPHWSASFGWLALSAYLAAYLPVFIAVTRVAVRRLGVPSIVAAPVVWTGLELARGHLLTGFSLALLGHSQVAWIALIQLSDLAGAYGVSFLVMLVAGCLERAAGGGLRQWRWWPLGVAAASVAAALGYGFHRLDVLDGRASAARALRVALIQGSVDTQFDGDENRFAQTFADYRQLSLQAVRDHRDLDLIIWPESMFTGSWPLVSYREPIELPAESPFSASELVAALAQHAEAGRNKARWSADELGTAMLVGSEVIHYQGARVDRYNSALLINGAGEVDARYDKMHLVMFGEYVPLGRWFPWLYALTPMSDGLTPGAGPVAMQVAGWRLSPSICFENTIPHLIRRQVNELSRAGQEPDLLVTVTNDGWFWGSSLLDLHLTCGVFRAVENRRPLLIAANTGLSAAIDATGRTGARGPRRAPAVLMAEVQGGGPLSGYRRWGDLPAAVCLGLSLLVGLAGMAERAGGVRFSNTVWSEPRDGSCTSGG